MIDRLAEIKAKRSFADPLHNDVDWLIAEVERLKAALGAQTWCPDCGKVLEIPNPLLADVERLEAENADQQKAHDELAECYNEKAAEVERLEAIVDTYRKDAQFDVGLEVTGQEVVFQ